ncbi:MAG TPA: nuclear transport factor 2 family protein [Candidatus Binatia bacterium]|jgi:ketosteroid isomerase-like protein|nr:nuclear transport factor 2 family protein [Candidatus Binatia bacterium]
MENPQQVDVQELVRRLEALEAERAILRTLYRYGHSIDYGLEQEWVDCFTADGVFDVRRRVGPASARYEGRAALAAFIAQHTRAPGRYHKHMLMEPVISVSGDQAIVQSYFTRLDATRDGRPFIRAFGRYLDRMVKGADGIWRFTERVAEVEAVGEEPA